jgi:hypothetical protein
MKRIIVGLFCLFSLLVLTGNAGAIESLIKSVATGCEKELKSYCSKVTPGEGRILACLYAHNDKISGRCEYALYDAAAQLERFVAALSYVVNECEDDLQKYCGSVRAGEGRLAECLLVKNKDKISKRCNQAMKDVDLTYKKQ